MDKETLSNYFSGKTTPDEEAGIIDWANSSPENYRQYLNERRFWDALCLSSANRQDKTIQTPRINTIWKITTAITSIAAVFILYLYISTGVFHDSVQKKQVVIVPPGQRVQVLLPDGTNVWLNSRSTLSYPLSFGEKQREVVLDGEAFFEVAHNTQQPFIVSTRKYNIHVLGTTFNVYAYNNRDNSFEASLLEGSIYISDKEKEGNSIKIKPNEYAVEQNGILYMSKIANPDRFRWKDGLICLDDEPFDSLMKKFSDYYDIDIEIRNSTLSEYRCTGKFRQSDGIEYALNVIRKDLNFTYARIETGNRYKIIIE